MWVASLVCARKAQSRVESLPWAICNKNCEHLGSGLVRGHEITINYTILGGSKNANTVYMGGIGLILVHCLGLVI